MPLSDLQGTGKTQNDAQALETRHDAACAARTRTDSKIDFGRMLLDEIGADIAVANCSLRTKKLQAMVTPDFYIRVKTAAAKKGLSISDFLRKVLEKVIPKEC